MTVEDRAAGAAVKVAVVGSRQYGHPEAVRAFVMGLPLGTVVISGGAHGVDRLAVNVAAQRGLAVREFPADWSRGRRAGPERNSVIVAEADQVVAFWDGQSRGTLDTITKARSAGKLVGVYGEDGTRAPL